MGGQPESSREKACREQVLEYLESEGCVATCGAKSLDDDRKADYDLVVDGVTYALEASTLPDSDPESGEFVTTREKRVEALVERIKSAAMAEGIGTGRHYHLVFPRDRYDRPNQVEALVVERALAAIRLDSGENRLDREGIGLWFPMEELATKFGIHNNLIGVPFAIADEVGFELVGVDADAFDVSALGFPRSRGGDRNALARGEIVPLIERKAADKADGLRRKGIDLPWVLALANEHLITGFSNFEEVFTRSGDASGFSEIFIVGGEAATPLVGHFRRSSERNG